MFTNFIKPIWILIFLLTGLLGSAQNVNLFPQGSRSEAMGRTSLTQQDVWSSFNNQAVLAHIDTLNFGLHHEMLYQIPQLQNNALVAAVPFKIGTLGANFARMGIEHYGENRFGLGFGKRLFSNLSIGVQLNYHLIGMGAGYPNKSAMTAEIGFLASVFNRAYFGTHVFNPSYSKLDQNANIPVVFGVGAGYWFNNEVLMTAELNKNDLTDLEMRLGTEYALVERFKLRAGFVNPQSLFSVGLGMMFKHFLVDFTSTYHHRLGYSPQLTLNFAPQKKNSN